jgi:hypothetical protein
MAYPQSIPLPPPGTELDALVAQTVICTPMPYSTSDAAALTLLEEYDRVAIEKTVAGWTCTVYRLPRPLVKTSGVSLAHAISLAALSIADAEREEQMADAWAGRTDGRKYGDRGLIYSSSLRQKKRPTVEDLEAKFWKRVECRGPHECWLWVGARDQAGYGVLKYAGKRLRASHVSFVLFHKHAVTAPVLAHRCDNPSCVNPFHLFEATHAENTQDMVRKGRHWRQQNKVSGTFAPRPKSSTDGLDDLILALGTFPDVI